MELIILKIIGCSAVLIAFYYLFLGRERTFKFNRMFLLTSLIFAYIIPFVEFKLPFKKTSGTDLIFGEAGGNFQKATLSVQESFDFGIIFLCIYIAISIFLFLQFLFSVSKILLIKGEKRVYKNHKLLITDKEIIPFSFLNTIYISRKNFIHDEIDERIFLHEKCHIEEKHSLDILFLELLKIFSWINPALYFYKKAMISNHEFLADEYVLKNNFNISNYQHLILNEIKYSQSFKLTHQFNFNNTKKRFIMMTSKSSKLVGMKKIILLPVLAILFASFTKEKEVEIPSNSLQVKLNHNIAFSENSKKVVETIPKVFENSLEKAIVKSDTIRKEKKIVAENSLSTPPPPPTAETIGSVDVLPSYPGGINEFRTLVSKNFDTTVLTGQEGLMKSTIYFTIDENGNVSDFMSEGEHPKFNEEALRSIKLSNQEKKWTPAKKDGQNVSYVFKMPLTMQFAAPSDKK